MKNSAIPIEVVDVITALEKGGFEAYLVGGCVRDLLLGRTPKDWDVTTNAKPDQIQALFPKTVYENVFGTVGVVNERTDDPAVKVVEVTPYRLESTYSDRRHPDQVKFSDKIEDDLKRRDFTINAMAVKISEGTIKDIVDLYHGVSDLKDRIIRTVGEPSDRFNEDALRMMRAIRFSVELGFTCNQQTFMAIQSHKSLIREVSSERVRDELTKILMSTEPKRGIEMLHDSGLLKHIIPEIEAGIGVKQPQAHAYDVWEHLLRTVQHAADKNYGLELRLAALFHDIGKPPTKGFSRETNQPTFFGHEVVGSRETRKILERLRFSRATIEKVVKLVRWHMFFADTGQITLSAVRRMIVNVGRENIWDLMNLRSCDRIGTGRPKENPYRLRKYKAMIEEALRDPVSVTMLKVDGTGIMKILDIPAGPKIGLILNALMEEVLDDPKLNSEDYLSKRVVELNGLPEAELKALAEKGKTRKDQEEEKELSELRRKHGVS
ncbi:HD domain-containing protein [Patescibacteria group bacterium]|nr:HD domain-containing protein [Patescibacteria group bacterium]MDE1940985.1 HD domain-containing protein [Patescibacteria group bacterium]